MEHFTMEHFTIEDLFDLKAARIANAVLAAEAESELQSQLQSCGNLPGQIDIFGTEDDYPY